MKRNVGLFFKFTRLKSVSALWCKQNPTPIAFQTNITRLSVNILTANCERQDQSGWILVKTKGINEVFKYLKVSGIVETSLTKRWKNSEPNMVTQKTIIMLRTYWNNPMFSKVYQTICRILVEVFKSNFWNRKDTKNVVNFLWQLFISPHFLEF